MRLSPFSKTKNRSNDSIQRGQSLIETLVAIFVLVTGLISAVSLAVASFNATDNTNKQITATALAREAIEGVRNVRDQYWLNDTLVACSGGIGQCYANWQGPVGARKLIAGSASVDYNPATSNWVVTRAPASYILKYNSSNGLYSSSQIGGVNSIYSRRIDIVETTAAPYTAQSPRLDITATVWWSGRNCPVTTNPATLAASCKVVLLMYLTNWRNY